MMSKFLISSAKTNIGAQIYNKLLTTVIRVLISNHTY